MQITKTQAEIIDYLDTTDLMGDAEEIELYLSTLDRFNITEAVLPHLLKEQPQTSDEIWTLASRVRHGKLK